jgi:hypothetical protein
MQTFPTITQGEWIVNNWHNTRKLNPTAYSDVSAGYTQTSVFQTFVPKLFKRKLINCSQSEADAILAFEEAVRFGHDLFFWNDIKSGNTYVVRFDESVLPLDEQFYGGVNDAYQFDLAFWQAQALILPSNSLMLQELIMGQSQVINLAAGQDIADLPVFGRQTAFSLMAISILTQGTPAGIDDANPSVITIKTSGGTTVVQKQYDTANPMPDEDLESLGTLAVSSFSAGEHLELTHSNGAAANPPAYLLIFE